ncbi:MAG TPA: excinuclease ABC subunit UvrA, partial [Anaerolineaceae bacterium]|nr:excinuclease ABC subunit UvrA [Anaerolineaceae bacterium]
GKHIGELASMTIAELQDFLSGVQQQVNLTPLGENLLGEILRKTDHLAQSRLGYLSLYREMPSLSGGEIQRLFLNSHLDSKMDSLIYILDEPTVGLHPSEKTELLKSVRALKEIGNTVIVVEHDRQTIEMAEHIIDIGPKAGIHGGEVVYQGDFSGLLESPASLTGQYLSGKLGMPPRTSRRRNFGTDQGMPCLTLRNARTNNLKDVSVSIPLGMLVGIAGVSGSGKSSLISDTLVPLLKRSLKDSPDEVKIDLGENEPDPADDTSEISPLVDRVEGVERISGCVEVSQAPIGRNVSSNPASYIGIWEKIRGLFAKQPEAVRQGLTSGHFSFNAKGACPTCGGSGRERIWLGGDFFIEHTCKACAGKRYCNEALSVRYKDKDIVEILEMSVTEAVSFFENEPSITATLNVMERIGMGYIHLGQPTPSLSGGEAQRIKLAKEIGRRRASGILYVLDEPTAGLSLYDTARLIQLLDELVAKGNSVIVIEHDPVVLAACDWIIELGPGGGAEGGKIIAEGTAQALAHDPSSVTGPYLQECSESVQ